MKNYSQSNEQIHILDYFENISKQATPPRWITDGYNRPTFIDIGANDGITLSNTRALAELGSFGVFVEPSPKSFAKLKANYKGLKGFYFYNYALGSHNGKGILHESSSLLTSADVGLVSTFEASEMQRFKSVCTYEPITVNVFKWKTFINRLKIKQFSFVNLDVEGQEMHVLPDMDLTATYAICIEHNGSAEKKKAYLECTSKYGIDKIIYESGENLIIVR
jgi:FkbM family methyltransferase